MMKICVLGSGSKGNATYIDIDGTKILVDCGFSKKEVNKRLATIGRSIDDIQHIFITHNHGDHLAPWLVKSGDSRVRSICCAPYIHSYSKNAFKVEKFLLSHDSESHGYTFTNKQGQKVAILMDTGCVPEEVLPHLFDCSAILIETNYDVDMLAVGKYPIELLERIASDHGHLRSECAAEVIEMVAGPKLQYVCCMHLSSSNNHPDLARFCIDSVLQGEDFRPEVIVSDQRKPTKLMVVM